MCAMLTDSDKQNIRQAIDQVELTTSGELVTVISAASDDYIFVPTLWAALIALAFPGVALMSDVWLDYTWLYVSQVILFFLLAAVFRLPLIKMRLIPKFVKHQRARRVAREQFFMQNLHHTQDRTGILIFVSVAEHYVEIIADQGINEVVDAEIWHNIINEFISHVKAKRHAEGFLSAIRQCGQILHQHFPAQDRNPNELPNHLVEI